MRVVINEHTMTVHKPARGVRQPADCGALRHVPNDRIRVTTEADLESNGETARCGRCFADGGGY